jgi:hypothetical protein
MSELLQQVLTDQSARQGETLPQQAASMASEFLPWLDQ